MRKFVVSSAAMAAVLFIAGCASSTPPAEAPAAQQAAPANSWTARLAALPLSCELSA